MHVNDLFTAPQVAKICSTDLKTIHNWVNRGEINYFRTPGRHLRFRRQDILEFLKKFGYPIPESFAPKRPKIVVVDSNVERLSGIKQALNEEADVHTYQDHLDALISIGQNRPSLVLANGDYGAEILHMVTRLATADRELPIITYGTTLDFAGEAKQAGAQDHIDGIETAIIRSKAISTLDNVG